MNKTIQKKQVYSLESEFISSLMNSPEFIYNIYGYINPNFFSEQKNKWLYKTIISIVDNESKLIKSNNKTITLSPDDIVNYLDKKNRTKDNISYINKIYNINPSRKKFSKLTDDIKRNYALKQLKNIINNTSLSLDKEQEDISVLDEHISKVSDIALHIQEQKKITKISDIIDKVLQEYSKNEGKTAGVEILQMEKLNKILNGFEKSRLYTLGARTKTGKSIFGMNIATKIAIQNIPVLYIDTELTTEEFVTRNLCHLTFTQKNDRFNGVTLNQIVNGNFSSNANMKKLVLDAKKRLEKLLIFHVELHQVNFTKLKSIINKFYHTIVTKHKEEKGETNHPAFFIVYDWLKPSSSLSENPSGFRNQEHQLIGDLMEKLKDTIKDYKVPALVLSQTGRSDSADIKESDIKSVKSEVAQFDRVVQLSDVFMWLSELPQKTSQDIGPEYGNQVLRILYNRSGPSDEFGITMRSLGHYMTYVEGESLKLLLSKVKTVKKHKHDDED